MEVLPNAAPTRPASSAPAQHTGSRLGFLAVALALLGVIIGGLLWFFSVGAASPLGAGWYLFSFAAGLTMIVLPCTLPLAFVIVPLSLGKGYAKGLAVAVAFGLGVAITLSLYGILAAILGKAVFGLAGAGGEVVKNIFYALAGLFAIAAALGELGFIRFRSPSYLGAAPAFVQRRHDLAKAFALGLFLGNIGVGCPHPATPIILGQIAITGDIFYGWLLFFVHALGRILPLLLLAVLGILGVNATKGLVRHKDAIARATAWGMVFVGGFLFTLGFFGHDWWVNSGQHSYFEFLTQEERVTGFISSRLNVAPPHAHGVETGTGFFGLPLWLGNWVLVALWALPLWWSWLNERRQLTAAPEAERAVRSRALRFKGSFFLTLTLLLGLMFIRVLPHWFLAHKALEPEETQAIAELAPPVVASITTQPAEPQPGVPANLVVSLRDARGAPLRGLRVSHERILHTIIISEDFAVFAHRHPEDRGPVTDAMLEAASFSIPYTFPQSGRYLIAVDYAHETHAGSSTTLLTVPAPAGTTVAPPVLVKDFATRKTVGSTTIQLLQVPRTVTAGSPAVLRFQVTQEGVPITDLEPYLGEPAHLAVVSANLSHFEHTHGEIHDPATGTAIPVQPETRFGPDIEAHVTFPYPGLYEVFAEFQHRGQVVVAPFLLDVAVGTGATSVAPPTLELHMPMVRREEDERSPRGLVDGSPMDEDHHDEETMMGEDMEEMMEDVHEEPDSAIAENPLLGNRLLYFVVSVVLIVLLTWGVVRYARV